jgi:hypothetical protein
MKSFFFCLAFTFIIITGRISAQNFTQTIKGRIIDQESQVSLPGASILIAGTNPPVGATSDVDGYYKISGVPIGRVSLQISYIGYKPVTVNNLDLTSGKELIVNAGLEEDVVKMNEVVVKATNDKSSVNNQMATISARSFSVEESQRFAGARNDVSRMATNFAGVSTANDAVNDIVIRGNTPNGLLWRLEGVDIPNPNHYGGMGATGGPVSMLNNNVLSNSDFMTGAFPAEYGDAFSGVFDLKMRAGNYEKHEFLGQIGINGFELGAEGPVIRSNRSSYLFNYRYSTLGVMAAMGINFGTGTAIPKYQDLSFKINFPTKKAGTFSLFGLGGINSIKFIKSKDDTTGTSEDLYSDDHFDTYSWNNLGVIGLNHTYIINPASYTKVTIAATTIQNNADVDTILSRNVTRPYVRERLNNNNLSGSVYYNHKLSAKNNFKIGILARQISFNLVDSLLDNETNKFETFLDRKGSTILLQPYIEWQYKPVDKLVFNAGLNYEYLALNSGGSLEPRLGIAWNFTPGQTFTLGYGLHSKTLPIFLYFMDVDLPDGSHYCPNKNLGPIRSHHFVAGYKCNITETISLKLEAYYQYLFNAAVDAKPNDFTILNSNSFNFSPPDSMKNTGKGLNYGLELSLEKYLDKGFYGLLTSSLFKSECAGSNGKMQPSAFDGRYVVNLVGGKEFRLKSRKEAPKSKKIIAADIRVCTAGGQRYTPVDVEKSLQSHVTVYADDRPYSKQFKDYFRSDIRIAYRMDSKKISQEFAFDIQNFTNQKNPLYVQFNFKTGKEEAVNQLGLFPMVQYRVIF